MTPRTAQRDLCQLSAILRITTQTKEKQRAPAWLHPTQSHKILADIDKEERDVERVGRICLHPTFFASCFKRCTEGQLF